VQSEFKDTGCVFGTHLSDVGHKAWIYKDRWPIGSCFGIRGFGFGVHALIVMQQTICNLRRTNRELELFTHSFQLRATTFDIQLATNVFADNRVQRLSRLCEGSMCHLTIDSIILCVKVRYNSMRQLRFSFSEANNDRSYGGQGLKRIQRRPVLPKRPHHITLRASQARGEWSFLKPKNYAAVRTILKRQADRHFVKLESWVNVGNHLHLKVRPQTRAGFANFLRSSTCLISRAVTKARKGRPLAKRFFDVLAWSRVLLTYTEEKLHARYFDENALEAALGKEVREYDRRLRLSRQQV
jgi:REP element-mobilizing transposase RayT